jgi:hypothetical protein
MKLRVSHRQGLFVTKNTWAYYERHCRSKIKHKTATQALGHAKSLNKTGEEFGFYQCRFCKNFHVGHNKTNPKSQLFKLKLV